MTSPRPSRTLYVVLAALLVLLPLLAVLQYRWIGEVNQAERRELEAHLNQDGMQFANDFDRELTRILSTFQIQGRVDRPDISDWFAQRYDDSTATYPNLVHRIFLARRSSAELELLQLDAPSRTMQTVKWPAELAQIQENIESRLDRSGRQRGGSFREPLATGNPIFTLPAISDMPRNGFSLRNGFDPRAGIPREARAPREPGRGPDRGPGAGPPPVAGFSIVELNPKVLFDDFIPTIVTRHFAPSSYGDYRVAIVSSGSNSRVIYKSDVAFTQDEMLKPDLRIPLFGLEPGRVRPPGGGPTQDFQRGRGIGGPAGPGFSGVRLGLTLGNWELLIKHRSGSLDAAIGALRRKDLAISFGILLMLGLSVFLVVVSSHRARALAQLQMDFVARVSHELRTPLAIIRSAAYNLATGVVADERGIREYASMVQNEGQRLSTMVDQILTFSRTQTARDAYDLRAVEVDEIVDRVVRDMSPALNAAGCAVDRKIAGNLPKVKADERAFAECLQNLVINAIKYGGGETAAQIQIEARRDGGNMVAVSVADFGPGIDIHDLEHIFEPFFRGRNVRSDTPGSGLGLNLVRRMMSAQGGRVSVESEPGHGTRFTLHLTTISEAAS